MLYSLSAADANRFVESVFVKSTSAVKGEESETAHPSSHNSMRMEPSCSRTDQLKQAARRAATCNTNKSHIHDTTDEDTSWWGMSPWTADPLRVWTPTPGLHAYVSHKSTEATARQIHAIQHFTGNEHRDTSTRVFKSIHISDHDDRILGSAFRDMIESRDCGCNTPTISLTMTSDFPLLPKSTKSRVFMFGPHGIEEKFTHIPGHM
jgi:hypothetical protein